MTVQPEQESAAVEGCWCCGTQHPEAELVRLGQHPEVGYASGAHGGCNDALSNALTNGIHHRARDCAAGSVPSGKW